MYAIVRSYMLVFGPNMCIVGLAVIMSLYGLRYVVARIRVWTILSSQMNLQSLDWEKLRQELYEVRVVVSYWLHVNLWRRSKLWSSVMFSRVLNLLPIQVVDWRHEPLTQVSVARRIVLPICLCELWFWCQQRFVLVFLMWSLFQVCCLQLRGILVRVAWRVNC